MIIDANIAVYWFVDTPLSTVAEPYLSRSDLSAPCLLRLETAAAMLKFHRSGMIGKLQIERALDRIERLIAEFVEDHNLLARAIDLALAHNHKIYDCLYLALALERHEPLATADRKLAALARKLSIETELIEPAL